MNRTEELPTCRAAVMSLALALAVTLTGTETACTRLEDACHVSEKNLLATKRGMATSSESTLTAAFVRTDTVTGVMFFERDAPSTLVIDGGVVGELAGVPSVVPHAVDVIVLDPPLERELRRETFAVPARLAGRKGSTEEVGAAWAPGRALFHWVETTTSTAPDGTLHRSAKLVLQSVDLGGVEGPAIEPSEAACNDCSIRVDAVDFAGARLVVYGTSGASPGLGQAVTNVGAFTLGPTGELVTRALPFAAISDIPRFEVQGGMLLLVGDKSIVPIGASLEVLGPTLPASTMSTAQASIDVRGDSFIAWVGPAQAASALSSLDAELLVQRYDQAGRMTAPPERLATTTASVRALARNDDQLLVMHGGSPRMLSLARIPSSSEEPPQKVGGDIVFDTVPAYDQRIIALGADQFRVVSIEGNQVVRREVTCASVR